MKMLGRIAVFAMGFCFLCAGEVFSAMVTLDYFPLESGSEWTYSHSPSTVTFDLGGRTTSMTASDESHWVQADGRIIKEMIATFTANGESGTVNVHIDEKYIVDSSSIEHVSQVINNTIVANNPRQGVTSTFTDSQVRTYDPPLTILQYGMEVGDSISCDTTVKKAWAQDRRENGHYQSERGNDQSSMSVTTTIVGEEVIGFDGKRLDTIKVRNRMTADGRSFESGYNLARFIGVVRAYEPIPGFRDAFVTYTLESTNLPIWEVIDTYSLDSSIGAIFDFSLNAGTVEIDIPADCLSDSCTLTVGDVSNIPESGGPQGMTWAVGINIDEPSVTLKCPVTVTIPYTQADLDNAGVAEPNDLAVYRWGSPSSGWKRVSVRSVDVDNQAISFDTSRLSVFGLGAPVSSDGGGGGGGCFIGVASGLR